MCLHVKTTAGCLCADLHAVHGLPELVQLMGGAERLQPDVRQLHLLLPELAAQLHHRLRLAVQTLRQSAHSDTQVGDVTYSPERRLCFCLFTQHIQVGDQRMKMRREFRTSGNLSVTWSISSAHSKQNLFNTSTCKNQEINSSFDLQPECVQTESA